MADVCGDYGLEAANRRMLHDFYLVMKANDDYLKFVFLTGVGKLGQINVFSGLNNIRDISLDPDFAAICGITQQELLTYFGEGIARMGEDNGWTSEETLRCLKEHYDGYHFSKKMVDVYNPFSLVNALSSRTLGDFWFQSGTPTRLLRLFMEKDWGAADLEGTAMSQSRLAAGDVLGSNLALACYYTGYLTIRGYDREHDDFILGYPNAEVRNGFFNSLL